MDRYDDVKAYTLQAKLAQQAKVQNTIPWPPRDEALALRCMDAYYNEQVAYYNSWTKQTTMRHIDLPPHLFQQWKQMPGRLELYNSRKALKAEWDKKQPLNAGLTACTNPFADQASIAAEQAQREALEAQALDSTLSANINEQVVAARQAHPGMTINFIDGTPSIPPANIIHRGDGQQNNFLLPPVQRAVAKQIPQPPPPSPRVEIADDTPPAPTPAKRAKNLAVPLVMVEGVDKPADDIADLKMLCKKLYQDNKKMLAEIKDLKASKEPTSPASSATEEQQAPAPKKQKVKAEPV